MDYNISRMCENDYAEWSVFVQNHSNSTIFHTLEWKKVLEDTYKFQPEYLVVRNKQDTIVGVSPAFRVKTLIGSVIVSQPFFEYGGPLIKPGCEDAYAPLLLFYQDTVDKKHVKYIELRPVPQQTDNDYISNNFSKQRKALDYYLQIEGKNFEKDIWFGHNKKSNIRTAVRLAQKKGVEITTHGDISTYYELYLKTIETLGSMPHPKKLFENIKKFINSDNVRFTYATQNGKNIAAMMSFPFHERNLMVGLVSDPKYRDLPSNYLLFNEQIQYSVHKNFKIVDFGRTRPDSIYEQFKKRWGATKIDMNSYVYPASYGCNVNPYSSYLKFSRFTKIMPWIYTRTGIGQLLCKRFP